MKDRLDAILQGEQARYLESLVRSRDPLLVEMERVAREEGHPIADPEVADFLRVLARLRMPGRVLEIGTNIGYSVIAIGRELGAGSTIETIEIDPAILSQAKRFVSRAALGPVVVFHQGPALEVLDGLEGGFDFVFIDCVKEEYPAYLDLILPRMLAGGAIVADNVLWKGNVARGVNDPRTDGIRRFNERIMNEPRLISSILPIGDGVSVSVVVGGV